MNYENSIVKKFTDLGRKHSVWQVFADVLAIIAITISNNFDPINNWREREDEYLKLINQYDKNEQELIVSIFAELQLHFADENNEPTDLLGKTYMSLELGNKWTGQFFTPMHVANLMALMTLDEEKTKQDIDRQGYITACDPCIGGGAMAIGFINACRQYKIDYRKNILFIGTDIDIKSVYMSYIQLSLLGIPAVIVHGDSLLLKEWSQWRTPAYVAGKWWKRNKIADPNGKIKSMIEEIGAAINRQQMG